MDDITTINPKKDTTLAILIAAQKRGWRILYFEICDLSLTQEVATGSARELTVNADLNCWFSLDEKRIELPLGEIDAIFMRKDPPVDQEFVVATHILSAAEQQGALVVNRPQSLRDCNEKLFAAEFPQCGPPLLVTSSASKLMAFYQQHKDVIFKPLDGMGGKSIFRLKPGDSNFSVIVEMLTENGRVAIMAQRFLPEIANGDKRILLIDGEPVPFALARIPAKGEIRGNLAAGGEGEARKLSDRDRWICDQVAPTLRQKGLMFVGIDVIGDSLTEINVTSPTCVQELNRQCNLDIGEELMVAVESKLQIN